jgi:hypothetical protein
VNWEPVTSKKITVPSSNIALEGYGTKGSKQIGANEDAIKFLDYYSQKLKLSGWVVENNFAADGINGSQIGYKKNSDYIVLSYKINPGKIVSKKDEPLQWTCPCKVDYNIFAGSSVVENPIVGGDKDSHGCIGSAGYSWCEPKQKCLRPWEEKCETIQSSIKLIFPNGGESVFLNDKTEYDVRWSISGINDLKNYYVKLSLVRSENVLGSISNKTSPATTSIYNWSWIGVGNYLDSSASLKTAIPGNDYKIKAELFKVGNPETSKISEDYSDNYFSIK